MQNFGRGNYTSHLLYELYENPGCIFFAKQNCMNWILEYKLMGTYLRSLLQSQNYIIIFCCSCLCRELVYIFWK
jgi:hypothetical protein